jgi:hypothetical protein
MATSYDDINNAFLNKITDDYLANLTETDLQNLLDKYQKSASAKFKKCKKLVDKDDVLRQYNNDLTNEEIEILANLMILEWLKPKIYSMELLKQSMSTKDFKLYSQANHLKELQELKKETEAEINRLIVSYTYSSNSLDDLKKVDYYD